MSSKNKKDADGPLGKLTNADIDKKTSSLILNYTSEEIANQADPLLAKTDAVDTISGETKKSNAETTKSNKNIRKKSAKKVSSKAAEALEKNKNELKEQVETLKRIKGFLNMEVSAVFGLGIKIIKRVNKKLFGPVKVQKGEEVVQEVVEEISQEQMQEEFSFKSLINLNIIFTDNKKKPLYFAVKNDSMYTQNDEILTVATISKIIDVFHETAEKLKKDPVPDKGRYQDIPLTRIMRNITEEEIFQFLFYVKQFPSKYIGQNYRISESFAAWVISGTPDS